MKQYALILLSTILVNNFVLVRFLGLCPVMGASKSQETALSMGLATSFVLTFAAGSSYLVDTYLLEPFGLQSLRTISFIVVIAACVQFTEIYVKRFNPLIHQVLGIFLPLITTNCAVLGVALLNARTSQGLVESLLYGFGSALGFTLALVLFAGVRERIDVADVPEPFRGSAIRLITAGLAALAFLGFSGLIPA